MLCESTDSLLGGISRHATAAGVRESPCWKYHGHLQDHTLWKPFTGHSALNTILLSRQMRFFVSTKTVSLPHTQKTFNSQYSNTLIFTLGSGANGPDRWFLKTILLRKLLYAENLLKRYLSVSIFNRYCNFSVLRWLQKPQRKINQRRLWDRGGQKFTCSWKKPT